MPFAVLPRDISWAEVWPKWSLENTTLYMFRGGRHLWVAGHNSTSHCVLGNPSESKATATSSSNMILGQARFALSSQQTWNGKDGAFDYEEFFKTLLKIFELDPEWKEETLCWWNE